MKKRDEETFPFSDRVTQQCLDEMKWLAQHWKCSRRSVHEQVVHQAYQRQRAYTAITTGPQEFYQERQEKEELSTV